MKNSLESQGIRRLLFLFAVLSSAGYAARTLRRRPVAAAPLASLEETPEPAAVDEPRPSRREPATKAASATRRAALAVAFTALFFAGAALTAGAGDEVGKLLDETVETTTTTESGGTTTAEAPAEPVPAPAPAPPPPPDPEAEPVAEPAPQALPVEEGPESAPANDPEPSRSSAAPAAPAASVSTSATPAARVAPKRPTKKTRPRATAKQEAAVHGGAAVIWLDRALPDPTPLARRLDRSFVYDLLRASRRANVDWPLVLGVVRARGHGGRVPANYWQLAAVAERLRDAGGARDEAAAVVTVMGSTDTGQRAIALARYNRAVGTETLVRGLTARKDALVGRVLEDRRAEIYPGGRDDLAAGRVDVRVVALIAYLAESFGQVTVTSLFSGHRLYARPGVVSAHVYGHAVDVAALGGVPITGHQAPGGLTEHAVLSILLLPAELRPRQVISLLGFGGASFPLADHHDHIHVGY